MYRIDGKTRKSFYVLFIIRFYETALIEHKIYMTGFVKYNWTLQNIVDNT